MARLTGIPPFLGTKHGVTIYRMRKQYFMRSKSNLTGERVKTDPAWAGFRIWSNLLKSSAPVAARIYKPLTQKEKKRWAYRWIVGQVMSLMRKGYSRDYIEWFLLDVVRPNRAGFATTGKIMWAKDEPNHHDTKAASQPVSSVIRHPSSVIASASPPPSP